MRVGRRTMMLHVATYWGRAAFAEHRCTVPFKAHFDGLETVELAEQMSGSQGLHITETQWHAEVCATVASSDEQGGGSVVEGGLDQWPGAHIAHEQ